MALDLQAWISWIFDQPVPEMSLYWNIEALGPYKSSTEQLNLVAGLFENAPALLQPYSDEQLNQGFWFLCGAESEVMRGFMDDAIPWNTRLRCIESFTVLFRDLFQARCTQHLSHLQRVGSPHFEDISRLNAACYMWWDFDCWYAPPTHERGRAINDAFLEVMQNVLALPHDACRESALHGLSHWHRALPTETVQIIHRQPECA
jgi:hypothetical protein